MKKQNQTGIKEKIIVGGVVVIAICMVLILLLLFLDHSNKAIDNQALNDAINGEYAADEHVPEELESEEVQATENPYYQNEEVSATESPYYKYDGELSDTPIIPTEIENEDILDYFGDDALKAKFKKEIMDYVVNYAKKYAIYGNPTIIPGCEPVYNTNTIFVDIHAADNRIISFYQNKKTKKIGTTEVYIGEYDWPEPVVYEGLYILNSSNLYTYLTDPKNLGLSPEEAREHELEILKKIKEALDERGYKKSLYNSTPYIYWDHGTRNTSDNKYYSTCYTFCASGGGCHPDIAIYSSTEMGNEYEVFSTLILKLSKEKGN